MNAHVNQYLLIGRKGGSSSSRRQRKFATPVAREAAMVRWTAEGFNTFWSRDPNEALKLVVSAEGPATPTTRRLPEEALHPDTGEPTNEARGARINRAFTDYATTYYAGAEDRATIVQDFLTDLCHFAHSHGVDVTEVVPVALSMFRQEIALEAETAPVDPDEDDEDEETPTEGDLLAPRCRYCGERNCNCRGTK